MPAGCALPDAVALSRADGDACSDPRAVRVPEGETADTPLKEASALLEYALEDGEAPTESVAVGVRVGVGVGEGVDERVDEPV